MGNHLILTHHLDRLVSLSLCLIASCFWDFVDSLNTCAHLLADLVGYYRELGPLLIELSASSIILVGDPSFEDFLLSLECRRDKLH